MSTHTFCCTVPWGTSCSSLGYRSPPTISRMSLHGSGEGLVGRRGVLACMCWQGEARERAALASAGRAAYARLQARLMRATGAVRRTAAPNAHTPPCSPIIQAGRPPAPTHVLVHGSGRLRSAPLHCQLKQSVPRRAACEMRR